MASSHFSKLGHLRPSSKSGAHLPWVSYHLVESWQNHVSHPSVMTYQTHLDHVLLKLSIYQQPLVESVHVPFLEKHVFCGTWINSSSTSLPLALVEPYSLKRNTPVLTTNNLCQKDVEIVSFSFLRVLPLVYIHLVWNSVYRINLITPN